MSGSHAPMAGPSAQLTHSGPAIDKGKARASPPPEPVRTPSPHGMSGAEQPSTMTMHSHTAMLVELSQTLAAIHHQMTDLSVQLTVLEQHTSTLKEYIQRPTGSTADPGLRQTPAQELSAAGNRVRDNARPQPQQLSAYPAEVCSIHESAVTASSRGMRTSPRGNDPCE